MNHPVRRYLGQCVRKSVELPQPLWVHYLPCSSMCSPIWKSSELLPCPVSIRRLGWLNHWLLVILFPLWRLRGDGCGTVNSSLLVTWLMLPSWNSPGTLATSHFISMQNKHSGDPRGFRYSLLGTGARERPSIYLWLCHSAVAVVFPPPSSLIIAHNT